MYMYYQKPNIDSEYTQIKCVVKYQNLPFVISTHRVIRGGNFLCDGPCIKDRLDYVMTRVKEFGFGDDAVSYHYTTQHSTQPHHHLVLNSLYTIRKIVFYINFSSN